MTVEFKRCFNPRLIDHELIKQLPGNTYTVENFYTFLEMAIKSPTQLLYLAMQGNLIIGFIWCEINILEKTLFVNNVSVQKNYWFTEFFSQTVEFLKKLFEELKLKQAFWISDKPALFEKHGFKKSKQILMEYKLEEGE